MKLSHSKKLWLSMAIVIPFTAFVLWPRTDPEGAAKTLGQFGYKPIKVGGYSWFGGSKGDIYVTKFTAINPFGDTVSGCVTKRLWGSSAVRLNN